MDILQVAVCEDDPIEQKLMLAALRATDIPTRYYAYNSGEDFIRNYHPGCYDLIFMDICMQGMSGVDVVKNIREIDTNVPIAFTTSNLKYTLDGYRLNVSRYIEKPITKKAVADMLAYAMQQLQLQPHIDITCNGRNISIPYSHILFFEQQGHYVSVSTSGGSSCQFTGKLNQLENTVPSSLFYRCHKSYLVNLSKIKSLDSDLQIFIMSEGDSVHIRRENLTEAKRLFNEFQL